MKRKSFGNRLVASPYIVWSALFIIVPLIIMFYYALTDANGNKFPIYFETKRMQPGATDDWYIEVYGMDMSVKFSTTDPNCFYFTEAIGSEQAWARLNVGNKPQFKTATGGIFEFGCLDAILQMWAAFMCEVEGKEISFGCCRPEETVLSHKLHTAALVSQNEGSIVKL